MKPNEPSKLQQFLNDKKAVAALAKSPDAQALAKMLSRSGDQAALQKAAQAAAKGSPEQLRKMVQSIVGSPDGAALLRRLDQTLGEKK